MAEVLRRKCKSLVPDGIEFSVYGVQPRWSESSTVLLCNKSLLTSQTFLKWISVLTVDQQSPFHSHKADSVLANASCRPKNGNSFQQKINLIQKAMQCWKIRTKHLVRARYAPLYYWFNWTGTNLNKESVCGLHTEKRFWCNSCTLNKYG